jgi:hypothetical protein
MDRQTPHQMEWQSKHPATLFRWRPQTHQKPRFPTVAFGQPWRPAYDHPGVERERRHDHESQMALAQSAVVMRFLPDLAGVHSDNDLRTCSFPANNSDKPPWIALSLDTLAASPDLAGTVSLAITNVESINAAPALKPVTGGSGSARKFEYVQRTLPAPGAVSDAPLATQVLTSNASSPL